MKEFSDITQDPDGRFLLLLRISQDRQTEAESDLAFIPIKQENIYPIGWGWRTTTTIGKNVHLKIEIMEIKAKPLHGLTNQMRKEFHEIKEGLKARGWTLNKKLTHRPR